MLNYDLIFKNNTVNNLRKYKFDQKKRAFVKKYENITLTSKHIFEIVIFLNNISLQYKNNNVPILIELEHVIFYDKLAYVVFECIIYYYKLILRKNIRIVFNIKHTIWTEGIRYSPLKHCDSMREFDNKFKYEIYRRHYRNLIKYNVYLYEEDYLSKIVGDIFNYMINNEIPKDIADELSEVLIELIGNGLEHSKTDTLIDIDVTDSLYNKNNDEKDNYYGVNVAIVTVSNILFFDLLKEKLNNCNMVNYGKRYSEVVKAFKQHQSYFNNNYNENDFYTIASFQDSISGNREKSNEVGGKGLTKLLKSVEDRAEDHLCYMLSGNRILFLRKEFLNSKDNYVGFNLSGDFLNEPPNEKVFGICDANISGVLYNLSFAIKKE